MNQEDNEYDNPADPVYENLGEDHANQEEVVQEIEIPLPSGAPMKDKDAVAQWLQNVE